MMATTLRSLLSVLILVVLLPPSSSRAAQFLNLSTRGFVAPNDHALIAGFIVSGASRKAVLVRGIGPSLKDAGLTDVLNDPTLELRDQNGVLLFSNDDWQTGQKSEIEQTGLAPHNDREAAIVLNTSVPGNYTAILRDAAEASGIGLIEVYDLSPTSGSLANVSTRGFVAAGDRAMIGGVIIGAGNHSEQIITRGLGPFLANVGVNDSLADPILELRSGNGALLATNDNWKADQRLVIEQTGIAPTRDLESAIVSDLNPGAYTAILRGQDNGVGTGLIEFYHLNAPAPASAMFSFENGLEGWTPKGTDVSSPPVQWSIESSPDRASEGTRSAKFELWNYNDAGKIWLERGFTVQPNHSYHVILQFSLGTQDWGDANFFSIIASVRTSPAVTHDDLTYQDQTGNGERSDNGYKWLEKSYDFHLLSADNGTLYVDIGIWGTWEGYRTYYIDNVRVTITDN